MVHRLGLTLGIFMISFQGLTAEILILTEEIAVELALKNNISVRIALQEHAKARAQRKEAQATAYPVISTYAQQTRNLSIAEQPITFPIPFGVLDVNGLPVALPGDPTHQQTDFVLVDVDIPFGNDNLFVYGLSLTQPLFDGRVLAALRSAGIYDQLAEAAVDVNQLVTIEQTKIAFYQALLAQSVLRVMDSSLELVQKNLQETEALRDAGKATEYDFIRASVQEANQLATLSNAGKIVSLAKANLKQICGLGQDTEIFIEGDLKDTLELLPEFETLRTQLVSNQPMLTQLEATSRLMKENILLTKAEFMPSLALTGTYQQQLPYDNGQFNGDDFRKATSVGLSFNLPLFNGFGSVARLQQARADYNKSVYLMQDVQERLMVELSSLYLTYAEAQRSVEAGIKGVEQANRGLDIAQQLYSKGLTTQLQVMDANNARNRAELGLAQAFFNARSARASLTRAIGLRTALEE